tara:strand:+ start:461 stop:835 length:375 start_codon:yes stop_codon:yes gene_type:complete
LKLKKSKERFKIETNKPYKRNIRLAEQLKILLSEHFLKKGIYVNINSPSMITITRIDLSEDLRYAKVFFTSMLDEEDKSGIEEHLNQNSNLYKYVIGKKIRTKNIPNFKFVYDNVFATKFKTDN